MTQRHYYRFFAQRNCCRLCWRRHRSVFCSQSFAGMGVVQSCLNKILRVMKREERTLFFMEKKIRGDSRRGTNVDE